MLRNPFSAQVRIARRIARIEATTAEQQAQGAQSAAAALAAGEVDGSGNLLLYGMLDVTPLSGFRLAAGGETYPDFGLLNVTPLGGFRLS